MRIIKEIKKIVFFGKKRPMISNVNYTHKFIFVHIPKNAGTSIYNALSLTHSSHTEAKEYKQLLGDIYEDFFSFCFVRNPFDRFISSYTYARLEESYYHSSADAGKTKRGKHLDYEILKRASLKEAVDLLINGKLMHDHAWNHWRPQIEWILGDDGKVLVDYIGRVEDIRLDFENICNILKLPNRNELFFLNVSEVHKRDYRKLIDAAMREKLEWYYKKDLELLGYSFENNIRFK